MKLSDMKISNRLWIGFGFILSIVLAIVATGNWLNMRNKNALLDGINSANHKLQLVQRMNTSLLQSGIAMRNIGLSSEVGQMQQQEDIVKRENKVFENASKQLAAAGLTEEERSILDKIAVLNSKIKPALTSALGHALAFNTEGATKEIYETIDPLSNSGVLEMTKLVQIEEEAVQNVLAESLEADKKLALLFVGLGALAVLTGGAFSFTITRSIVIPLKSAVLIAETVAKGDLTLRVAHTGQDEISQLISALGTMNSNLAKTVGEVRESTDSISLATQEIASGSFDLSKRTESQAASLEETASSMEELTATVRHNSDHVHTANQLIRSASCVATSGGAVVNQVIETMGVIKARSSKIVDIIAVIDGIAFQTNILALNAAVEAARAGEQGRGFAVVASEVRNLAQRSAIAAKDIASLIEDSVAKIDNGVSLVEIAGKTMSEVVNSVESVSSLMNEITVANDEQRIGIERINEAILNMDQITQSNAALVEEGAASADMLKIQTENLARAVANFTVKHRGIDRTSKLSLAFA